MRIAVIALLISIGAPAMCQSAGPSADQTEKGTLRVFRFEKNFDSGMQPTNDLAQLTVRPIVTTGLTQQWTAVIDPKMVVHPPQSNIGVQPPGIQVARNLYPDLQLLRIDESKMKVEPIPTTFPNTTMEKIPTTWPQFKVLPVQSGNGATAAK